MKTRRYCWKNLKKCSLKNNSERSITVSYCVKAGYNTDRLTKEILAKVAELRLSEHPDCPFSYSAWLYWRINNFHPSGTFGNTCNVQDFTTENVIRFVNISTAKILNYLFPLKKIRNNLHFNLRMFYICNI